MSRLALRLILMVFTGAPHASCAAGSAGVVQPAAVPQAFTGSGEVALAPRWWTAFRDPALDALIREALRSNLDLRATWERVRQARAVLASESAGRAPDLAARLDVAWEEPTSGRGPTDSGEPLQLGLMANYEVDLWGRMAARVEAAEHRARASFAEYRTAALSLSAEAARTWVRAIEVRGQLALTERQIAATEQVLQLLEYQFGTGQVRSVDILRQRQLVESARALQASVEARLRVLEHQLAVLLGRPPEAGVPWEARELPALPPLPETGLPSELVRRRPDVQRAFSLLLAADRELAAAVRAQYPSLEFAGALGTGASRPSELFESWFASLAGSLIAPLLNGPELRAEVDRTRALQHQRLYEYGQATLIAFREVEDALVEERKQLERLERLQAQVELGEKVNAQLRIEYFNGLVDYIDVLTAQTTQQELERELLTSRRTLLELRIALYRALAGGFETGREAT